jgi:serine-type D-Ala-D-Ala carboxypeptidase/endopeptidase
VLIINQNAEDTYGNLFNTVLGVAEDLKTGNKSKKIKYGYRLTKNEVIFTYKHPKNLDEKLIKTISVVGSFNEWNVDNKRYEMTRKGKDTFELVIPKLAFEKDKVYLFRFVINKVGWVTTPKNALNTDKTEDNNLTFEID